MAQSYWPFDGVDTTETQYSQLFRRLQSTGVWGDPGDGQLKVVADAGLDIAIQPGFALIRGHMYENDGNLSISIDSGDSQARIDIVVISLDPTLNTIVAGVVKGLADVSPVAPDLAQTDAGVYELEIARISVAASAAAISAGNISDTRSFMGLQYGIWTTAKRPASPRLGQPGFNSTLGYSEMWNGSVWSRTSLPATVDADSVGGRHFLDGTSTPGGGTGVDEDIYFQWQA